MITTYIEKNKVEKQIIKNYKWENKFKKTPKRDMLDKKILEQKNKNKK